MMTWSWLQLLIAPLVILVPIWLGKRIAVWHLKRLPGGDVAPLLSVVGSTLGYFAFMVAVTYQLTSSRFQSRSSLLLEDASTISTAMMQADLLNEPYRTTSRTLIREYTEIRAAIASYPKHKQQQGLERTNQILQLLWNQVKNVQQESKSPNIAFSNAIINMKQANMRRVTIAIYSSIPSIIMMVLYFVAFFTMFLVGYQFGTSGKSSSVATMVLAVTFTTVIWLIFALDHPEFGIINLDQRPIIELLEEFRNTP